ncbi:MAG: DEAD/DEAH box helicase [Gammaproteobacteria bacterium]|nr:DEAD/DEAH box helicase [Gammaproteobacteria bacterium]
MTLAGFHPAVRAWFNSAFAAATPVQEAAWSAIDSEQNVLIAAPTGSGKTFAAFLCAINELVMQSQHQPLGDSVQVLYVSPLKALSNDIERNLQLPLNGIDQWLAENEGRPSGIRALVRTGDTPPGDREKMRRKPPQILVTTPESLYLLLTSDSGRSMLTGVSSVIVDEIHSVAGSKRGSHLALSMARLDALNEQAGRERARRIGLSATQNPIAMIAGFLTGGKPCEIVDTGHQRDRDLSLVIPSSPLSPVMANEVWEEIYDRLEALIEEHRTTLIFVNTRRLAERLARHLAERIGGDAVTAHHGSLSRGHRLEAEQALKSGQLKALVATASLELGIDIGHVDLVCQIGSPGSISAFIQRVGRAGHAVGETPKGRLFPVSRDDLAEGVALIRSVRKGLLDRVVIPEAPLDVLAQQLVAEVSAREWETGPLFELVRETWPYRELTLADFDSVVDMLAGGYATRRGRRSAYVYHDAINGRLRARPAARLTALQNGGAIPDHFDYEVVMLPQSYRVGTLNEDFAFESLPGDIFQLGNTSYRILKIEQGRVLVEDAKGQPPTIPFWFGDAPGRSDELSAAVSGLRNEMDSVLSTRGPEAALSLLTEDGIEPAAAIQLVNYMDAARQALGMIPTHDKIVLERFFDDTGDMHLVVHAPLGSRIMRAWGLALRKRFCRHFNFELQAAALEDSLILSLGETHSFETKDVPGYLKSASVRQVLVQALLDAPMFEARWRWNATIALAVQRMRNGQKLPPQWQRNQAEDLVAVVFPDQLACLENIRGEREIPDHPLVNQTISDCMTETMDIDGLEALLKRIEAGAVEIRCLDLTGPSPLSAEIINARPYAFLDDGEAENRRTRAISQNYNDLGDAATLSIISVDATEQVKSEAWIRPRNPDELHDGLLQLGFLTQPEFSTGTSSNGMALVPSSGSEDWAKWFQSLAGEMRASCAELNGSRWWVATERLEEFCAVYPEAVLHPDPAPVYPRRDVERDAALVELMRSRLSGLGPVDESILAGDFALAATEIERALLALQNEGYALVMAGATEAKTWCERRLLARIHRYSRENRRKAARPVPPAAFMRFLIDWHGLDDTEGELEQALSLLEGWTAPVAAWEQGLLAKRCADYSPQRLDEQFLSGFTTWFRPGSAGQGTQQLVAATPIAMVSRRQMDFWRTQAPDGAESMGSLAGRVFSLLRDQGAMFTVDIERNSGLMEIQVEQAIAELVARGLITSDAFSPLRWLVRSESEKRRKQRSIRRRGGSFQAGLLGRWSVAGETHASASQGPESELFLDQARLAAICETLLRRYGVVFRAVLERESLVPPWRYLLRYLRRMEDRGEVYGGRFVDGFSGEQFALPEAVGLLRRMAAEPSTRQLTVISACDPLNLGGVITPGVKTVARSGNRILLFNGVPVARLQGDELELLGAKSELDIAEAERYLRVVRALPASRAR